MEEEMLHLQEQMGKADSKFHKLMQFVNEQFKMGNTAFKKLEGNITSGCQDMYTHVIHLAKDQEEIKQSMCTLAGKCQDMAMAVKANRSHIIAH
jgi:monomeric isocitrate dehydrogenase